MSLRKERYTLIPTLAYSSASHLILQSGLSVAERDIDLAELGKKIRLAERPLFTADIFSHGLAEEILASLILTEKSVFFALNCHELKTFYQKIEVLLDRGAQILLILHREASKEEADLIFKLRSMGQKIQPVFVENKEKDFYSFTQGEYYQNLGTVGVCYLPKLSHWDVLLSPLEVAEAIEKLQNFKNDTFIVVMGSESLQSSTPERTFYLNPGRSEYSQLFNRRLPPLFARGTFKFLIGTWLLPFASLLKFILSPYATYRVLRQKIQHDIASSELCGMNIKRKIIFLSSKIYWKLYAAAGSIKLVFIKLYWFGYSVVSKIFWKICGLKDYIRIFSMRLYWTMMNSVLMKPFRKIYYFTRYQIETRLFGKPKNES